MMSLREYYVSWILREIGGYYPRHQRLIRYLHEIPFKYSIPRDRNRAGDALFFRANFLDEIGSDNARKIENDPCSVLEVLASLAIRIDNEYVGDPSESRPDKLFWEMICNLKLDQFDDRHFYPDEIDELVSKWLNRDFDYDGRGSIFPLRQPKRDQRDVEIWVQMNDYLFENYGNLG